MAALKGGNCACKSWYGSGWPFKRKGYLWLPREESKYLPVLSPCADFLALGKSLASLNLSIWVCS